MTETGWDAVVHPVQPDDTQEFDPADFAEPEPEDAHPTDPGPSPYTDPEIDTTGPQDEAPSA